MIYFWGSFIYKSDSVGVFASPAMNLATRRWLFYTSFFLSFPPVTRHGLKLKIKWNSVNESLTSVETTYHQWKKKSQNPNSPMTWFTDLSTDLFLRPLPGWMVELGAYWLARWASSVTAAAMAKSPEVKLAVFGRAGVGKSGNLLSLLCTRWRFF